MAKKLSYDEIKDYINGEQGNKCILITTEDEFNEKIKINNASRIKFDIKCKCGNIYNVEFRAFKLHYQRQCPFCGDLNGRNKRRMSLIDIKTFIEETFSKKANIQYYLMSSEYKNADSLLEIVDEYGYRYKTTYAAISANLNGNYKKYRILPFHKSNPYTIDNINTWIIKNANAYKLLSTVYEDARNSKLLWQCSQGHIYETTFDHMMQGYRCPECDKSKGERKVEDWLIYNNIAFQSQYRFDDCRKVKPLPFDFAIFADDNKTDINYLVEYDGEMHYQAPRYTKNKNKMIEILKAQQDNDSIKNEYCKKHNLKLIRIPYWEFDNIEKILEKEIINSRAS